jgi:hypothetical protein
MAKAISSTCVSCKMSRIAAWHLLRHCAVKRSKGKPTRGKRVSGLPSDDDSGLGRLSPNGALKIAFLCFPSLLLNLLFRLRNEYPERGFGLTDRRL